MVKDFPVLLAVSYEWFIVAGVVLVLFGGTQIPKLARSLGQAQKEFKEGQADDSAPKGEPADKKVDDK